MKINKMNTKQFLCKSKKNLESFQSTSFHIGVSNKFITKKFINNSNIERTVLFKI